MTTYFNKLKQEIEKRWSNRHGRKIGQYVNQFTDCRQKKETIVGKVQGNHGVYTVSMGFYDGHFSASCSCYIGKGGYCHHCAALGETYLQNPNQFIPVTTKTRAETGRISDMSAFLEGVTLEELLGRLRRNGITQKAFGEAIGMSSRHLSSMKSSELHNRPHRELGATKLAALWVLENLSNHKTRIIDR